MDKKMNMIPRTLITINRFWLKDILVSKSTTWSQYVQTLKVHKLCGQRVLTYDKPGSRLGWSRQIHHFSSCSCSGYKVQVVKRNGNLLTNYKHTLGKERLRQCHVLSSCPHSGSKHVNRKKNLLKGGNIDKLLMHHGYATMAVDDKVLMKYLESLENEYNDLLQSNSRGIKSRDDVNMRKVFLMPIVELHHQLKERSDELNELKQLAAEDDEMKIIAEKEEKVILEQMDTIKQQILDNLVPDLKYDKNDAIVELNPGVGGEEAKLFTRDLYDMYQNYTSYKGWTFNGEEVKTSETGGLSIARISISGYDVFKTLKYESGIHRVQRVPRTESKGRIHTSTAAVAILPQPNEIDITIDPSDLKIDTFKSSGPGGQHVQTTDTAVRVTHIPTGIAVPCQETRSQIENKKRAIQRLTAKLYEAEFNAQISKLSSQRKLQVGTKGRSEKIRTYNLPQNRVTDHRIHYSANVEQILDGGETLDKLISCLQEESRKENLVEILENFKKKHL